MSPHYWAQFLRGIVVARGVRQAMVNFVAVMIQDRFAIEREATFRSDGRRRRDRFYYSYAEHGYCGKVSVCK